MKRTFLVRALFGAAIPMTMAEDVPAATQAAPEGGAPVGESASGAVETGSTHPSSLGADSISAGAPLVSDTSTPPGGAATSGDAQEAGGAAAGERDDVASAGAIQSVSLTGTASVGDEAPQPSISSPSGSVDAPAVAQPGESSNAPAAGASTPANVTVSQTVSPSPISSGETLAGSDAPAVAQGGEPAASQPGAAATVVASSGAATASGTAAAPLESSGTIEISSGAAVSSTSSSSSATTTLSTAAAPDTSSTAALPDPTTAALSSASADATLADVGGIQPTAAPTLDPALGQIPAPPAAPAEPAADRADAAALPLMFEIHSVTENVPPIRIYADGTVEGLPAGYQLVINRGAAVATELENLKADDRHLSLLASWHKEMEVLGRGLSGEVTRLLGETKKYLEDVL